jgi:hypothetical protein
MGRSHVLYLMRGFQSRHGLKEGLTYFVLRSCRFSTARCPIMKTACHARYQCAGETNDNIKGLPGERRSDRRLARGEIHIGPAGEGRGL